MIVNLLYQVITTPLYPKLYQCKPGLINNVPVLSKVYRSSLRGWAVYSYSHGLSLNGPKYSANLGSVRDLTHVYNPMLHFCPTSQSLPTMYHSCSYECHTVGRSLATDPISSNDFIIYYNKLHYYYCFHFLFHPVF